MSDQTPRRPYRAAFFDAYDSTHVQHRKGERTLAGFRRQAIVWRRTFGPLLPKDRSVQIVDVGCGAGSVLWWLQQLGYARSEGVDVSPEQVAIARRLGVREVEQADLVPYLKDRSNRYDVVLVRDVLEHFTKTEILEVLEVCRQALKTGGRLVVQVPNAESPFFGRIRYGDFTHEVAFSASSLVQLLSVCGFVNVECHPMAPVSTSFRSALRLPLWWLVEAFYRLLLFAELGRGSWIVTQGIIAVCTRPPTRDD